MSLSSLSSSNSLEKSMKALEAQPQQPRAKVRLATKVRISLIVAISLIQCVSIVVLAAALGQGTGGNSYTWSVIIFNLLTLLVMGTAFHHRMIRFEHHWIRPRSFAAFGGFAFFTTFTLVTLSVRLSDNGLVNDFSGLPDPAPAAYIIFALSSIAVVCSFAGLLVTHFGCQLDVELPPNVKSKPVLNKPLPTPLKKCKPDLSLSQRYELQVDPPSPASSLEIGHMQRKYSIGAIPVWKPNLREKWSEVSLK